MKARRWLIPAVFLCFIPATGSAEWERTVDAWDTRTADQGAVQIALWNGYQTWESHGIDGNDFNSSLFVAYGIADNWSASIGTSYDQWDMGSKGSESGLSDTSLITVYRFQDEAESGLDLAIKGSLRLPTGDEDKDLGSGNWEPQLMLLAAKSLGPVVTVVNLGVRNIIDPGKGEKDFTVSSDLECVFPVSDRLSFSGILYGETSRWDSSEDDIYLDLGVGVRFAPNEKMFISGAAFNTVTSDIYNWSFTLALGIEI